MDGCKNAISESIPNSIITIGTRSILMMRFFVSPKEIDHILILRRISNSAEFTDFIKKVTKFGNSAKVDCPEEYLGCTSYLVIL